MNPPSSLLCRALLSCGVLALLGSCAPSATVRGVRSPPPAALDITISVFSGRPDPHYRVPEGEHADEIRARVRRAAVASAKPPGDSVLAAVLGYRGISVENSGQIAGIPAWLAVHDGIIELGSDQKSWLIDEGRGLERYLLDLALQQRVIDAKLHAEITARW
jgi:hypothetical protein